MVLVFSSEEKYRDYECGERTDMFPRLPIRDTVQQSDQTAGIPDRLPEPDHLLLWPDAFILRPIRVLLPSMLFVRIRDGKDKQEGEGGSGHEGE